MRPLLNRRLSTRPFLIGVVACVLATAPILTMRRRRRHSEHGPGRIARSTTGSGLATYATLAEWQQRASYLRDHVLCVGGIAAMPERTPLRP